MTTQTTQDNQPGGSTMTAQTSQDNQPEQTRKDFEVSLVAKAWTDEAFRQQLLSNPKAVVEQEFGGQLPEGMNVEIIQEPANTLYIVLPAKAESSGSDELNEEELEAVAGGATPIYGVAGWAPTPWSPTRGKNQW